MGYWGVVNNCIKNSNIILLIIDARIPEESINKELIKKSQLLKKEMYYVFNKSDLISKTQKIKLKEKYNNSFIVSNKSKKSIINIREFLEKKANEKNKSLRIAILGYPNAGKSTILNTLIPNANLKVSSISGTTKKTDWIRYKNLRFMDTPGVIPRTDSKINLGITASKDPHKINNPEKVAINIINILRKKNQETIKNIYNIDFKNENDYEVFLKIGLQKKLLIKGGEVDENRTAIKIIDEWQKGKISLK